MGSTWGDSGGTTPGGDPGGVPDPGEIEIELVDDDDDYDYDDLGRPNALDGTAPSGDGPNAATSDRETIGGTGGDEGPGARLLRLPRAVRVLGVLAAASVLAFAVWPASARRDAAPQPQPLPTPTQVSPDLYKVHLAETSLETDEGADHAVLGLELTNSATARLEVVSAELWDAVGTRIGSSAVWPAAQGLAAGSTESVPVTLPYACDNYEYLPVLPLMIRFSVSTPQNPSVRRDYSYGLTGDVWDSYMRQRAWRCARPDAEVSASAIDATQPIGAPTDPQGFELTFTLETGGTGTWNVESAAAADPAVTITGTGLPVPVSPGQTAHVTTHWHLNDCTGRRPAWTQNMSGVKFTARMANPPPGTGDAAEQVFYAELRPGLVQEMVLMACGD